MSTKSKTAPSVILFHIQYVHAHTSDVRQPSLLVYKETVVMSSLIALIALLGFTLDGQTGVSSSC